MDIKDMLLNDVSDKDILKALEEMHSFDIVEIFKELKPEYQERLKQILPTEQFADVLSYLEPEHAAELLQTQSLDEQVLVVQNLEPDDAADIINEFGKSERLELINELDASDPVINLIQYKEYTAGAYMNNDILFVEGTNDVKDITKKLIKSAADLKSVKTIFVTDNESKYLGQIALKTLVRSKSPLTAQDILKKEPSLNVFDDVDVIIKHMKYYGAYDVAVLNDDQKIVGAITTDDLLDIYRDEAVEDIEKLSLLPDTDVKTNVFNSALRRLPWLIIMMILSIPLALITSNYEEILTSVVILALFQPLLLDSGGNVAHQTLAVTLVGLTSKEGVSIKDGLKEALSGMIIGLALGILAFIAAYILSDLMNVDSPLLVSIVVSLTIWIIVILAPIIGFLVPFILSKLNFDPASSSGPFITTIIDVLCLVIYFGLATLLLGGIIHA
jgi:magnesium transporter